MAVIKMSSFVRGVFSGFQAENFVWELQCWIWYITPLPGMLQFQSIQPTR